MQFVRPEEIALLVPLGIATLAGGIIGIERELRHKAAGISTNMLICAGACLFTLISARVDATSTSRIAANILQGVGFIGAGLILKESTTNTIRGLTSAAGIWMAAAIGMSFGYGYYLLGMVGTVIAIIAPRTHRLAYRTPLPAIDAHAERKEEK
jgi:putative Mg2+ transporter-C (MgtC) family protein